MNLLFISLFITWFSPAQSTSNMPEIADAYISQYKDIAISEMHRTGIPASIKLAQGLLESDWGRSNLATEANNHFGIKCGNSWTGGSFFKTDDDYHKGKLINSCFRKYDDATQSYIDHSEFLSKPRYAALFKLDPTDYKRWAKGLKKAGYATDKKYPKKLINIIEKYDLSKFDQMRQRETEILANTKVKKKEKENAGSVDDSEIVFRNPDETPQESTEVYRSEHMEAVEITSAKTTSKARTVFEGQTIHYVKADETMEIIASLHQVDLNKLYIRNRMPLGAQPVVGEMIKLKGALRLDGKPKYIRYPKKEESEFLFVGEP